MQKIESEESACIHTSMLKEPKVKCEFCHTEFSKRRIKYHAQMCGGTNNSRTIDEQFLIIDWDEAVKKTAFYYGFLKSMSLKETSINYVGMQNKETIDQYRTRLKQILQIARKKINVLICQQQSKCDDFYQIINFIPETHSVYIDDRNVLKSNYQHISEIEKCFEINFGERSLGLGLINSVIMRHLDDRVYNQYIYREQISRYNKNDDDKHKCIHCQQWFNERSLNNHETKHCEFAYTPFTRKIIKRVLILIAVGDDGLQQSKAFANAFCIREESQNRNDFFISTIHFKKNETFSEINYHLSKEKSYSIFTLINKNVENDNHRNEDILKVVYVFASSSSADEPITEPKINTSTKDVNNYWLNLWSRKLYVLRLHFEDIRTFKFLLKNEKDTYPIHDGKQWIIKKKHKQSSIYGFYHSLGFYRNLDWMMDFSNLSMNAQIQHSYQQGCNEIRPEHEQMMDKMQITPNFLNMKTWKSKVLETGSREKFF